MSKKNRNKAPDQPETMSEAKIESYGTVEGSEHPESNGPEEKAPRASKKKESEVSWVGVTEEVVSKNGEEEAARAPRPPACTVDQHAFPIVGMGASAGALP